MSNPNIPENRTLVSDPQYQGHYVAIADRNRNDSVVSVGDTYESVYNEALELGYKNMLVVYVPKYQLPDYCK